MVHLPFTLGLTLSCLSLATASLSPSLPHAVRFHKRQAQSKYPEPLKTPPISSLPPDWVQALNDAVAAGKIPNIPVSTPSDTEGVAYPNGVGGKDVCSWTLTKCEGPGDITDAPDGEWTIAFDDGPTADSPTLYNFLKKNKQRGTHFMIGSQILAYPDAFKQAVSTDQEIALHTWSHSLLTTKDNMGVLAELGWNMQIIYDLSGRVPQLYRPPQGDVDNRVRAIASQVFNLTAVMWNAECNDWCLDSHGHSSCPGETPGKDRKSVRHAIKQALNRPKSPGVSILEHELNPVTIGLFTQYYGQLAPMGWKAQSVSDHYGRDWYVNAVDNRDTPVNVSSMLASTSHAEVAKQNQTGSSQLAAAGSQSTASNGTGTGTTPASSSVAKQNRLASNSNAASDLTLSLCFLLSAAAFASFLSL